MISFKKSYAEQMLQLALALSLLQVDPRDYLNQGWDSQLEMRNGDGWQLEMLRAVPISEYPYANRKAMMPLIEDLVRFDRQNIQDITTYLLNVQNAQSNQTNVQDHDNSVSNNGNGNSGGGTASVSIEQSPIVDSSSSNVHEIDLFLNSNLFEEEISIVDQNLADLSEYGDISLSSFPYFGLPFKDEPPDEFSLPNVILTPSTSSANDIYGRYPSTSTDTTSENYNWHDVRNSTLEILNNNNDNGNENKTIEIKKEVETEEEDEEKITLDQGHEKEIKNEEKEEERADKTDAFLISTVEMTKEESEIVEVLWKQDVDLGYSLTPSKSSTKSSESTATKNSDDDIEKLKALEELKLDKPKDDNSNKPELDDGEWAGIPFRIDNETGEYIRQPSLQLDEILQDVLQLGDLTVDGQEESIETKEEFKEDKDKQNNCFLIENTDTSLNTVDGCQAAIEPPQSEVEIPSLPSPLFDFEDASELEADLEMMIQSAAGPFQHHRSGQNYGTTNSAFRQSGFHHHHHHHQSRVPLSRGLSMEQRLQDIANLFNPIPGMGCGMGVGEMSPYPHHYPTHYSYQTGPGIPQHGQFPHHTPHPSVLHNPPLADLGTGQPHYGHNLGSAVSSSMHLTNSTHETDAGATGYKTDSEMMYYSNTSSELNHTTDGFINSILNDEDLQLMDMGVNENFCGMRMLDSNATSNNSSVLGSASGGSHSSNHLLPTTMPTSLGPLGSNSATGNEALGSATGDRLDASSDSAVSSMGSERVPSLSDGEWGDAGSDSAQEYHHGKYGGPYDYSYNSRLGDVGRQPVAQKKHQMFGKRYFQEQPNIPGPLTHPPTSNHHQHPQPDHISTPVKYEYEPSYGLHHAPPIGHNLEGAVGPMIGKNDLSVMSNADMKYPCSLDFSVRTPRTAHDIVSHNHTYTLPQGTGSTPRPQIRDKKQKRTDDEHLTRDEKRARSLSIPISVSDIINLPMDEFNERLSKYDLTENQLSLIRDIRRRGKNKVAAQNCRKRKLDQILSLEDEVKEVRRRKDRLYQDREIVFAERKRIANKFAALHRHIFQYLRDPDGNPCSPSQYSLQQAADGSVYLLRRENKKPDGNGGSTNTNVNGGGGNNGMLNPNSTPNIPPPNHTHTHNNANGTTSHHHHVSQGPSNGNHQKE